MSLATMPVGEARKPVAADLGKLVGQLREQVRHNSRRWKILLLLETIGVAISAPLAYLWLIFFIDNTIHLPLLGRLLANLGFLACAGWVAVRIVRRWRNLRFTEDQVALAIEKQTPGGVQNRLINAVQIARLAHDEDLSEAVVRENYQRLQQVHLEHAGQVKPAMLRLGLAGALILVGLGFWLLLPDQFSNAAARILLPLADIQPLYRTTLTVEPGDVEASGDVVITVSIEGERPKTLTILKNVQGKRTAEVIPVEEGDAPVQFTFRDLDQSLHYAVQGGDFTSPYYRIEVARKAALARLSATYRYPAYTNLPEKTSEGSGGDLEAIQGTHAQLTFLFDHPVDEAAMILERPANGNGKSTRVRTPLSKTGPKEYKGDLLFQDVLAYRLETRQGNRPVHFNGPFAVRVLKDQEPKLDLSGLERRTEVLLDAVMPLKIAASDDYGLETVGLFFRKNTEEEAGPWQAIVQWPGKQQTTMKQTFSLAVASLKLAEGEKVELALRARDTDPLKKEWTTGAIYELLVGGDGVALQLQYEQILRTEKQLKELIARQQKLLGQTAEWLGKLSGQGDLRWDDPKNIAMLHAAVKEIGKGQEAAKSEAGKVARGMVPQVGNLNVALGMLADTEMVRATRILDAVPSRDEPQAKRTALGDARLTQERIVRSLQEMQEQYEAFKSDWELSHLIPITKMLAERQNKLHDQSRRLAVPGKIPQTDYQRTSTAQRQTKLIELCQLVQPAFGRCSDRLKELEPTLSTAFKAAGVTIGSDTLHTPMKQAAAQAGAGQWAHAAKNQETAARILTEVHAQLRQAQILAAQLALAALKEKAKSDLEAQKELEKLPPGSAENFVRDFDLFKIEDTMRLREVANAKKSKNNPLDELDLGKTKWNEVDRKILDLKEDSGVRQDTDTLTLGKEAGKTPLLPMYKGKDGNKVKPFMQEKFDDLVGKLLDEAGEMAKNYQSITLSTNRNNNDPGDIAKAGGSLNSTGAVAATGNKKPPTLESGGVARTGRQGARSYGIVGDDEGLDRRGRDKALNGKEQVADQAGLHKLHKSDDPQKDMSTGIGGKKVQSDDNHFSLADAGKWKDDMVKRLDKPQKKNYIVERQGDKIDAKIAALLRDTTSQQEQMIERLKAIKKELKNLYLPTDHLEKLEAEMQANLASLKDRPEPEQFRLQMQTLDKLRGMLRVFRSASAGFQPSLPRQRTIRGRVLDEPSRPTIPGYEDAVKHYYQKLAAQ